MERNPDYRLIVIIIRYDIDGSTSHFERYLRGFNGNGRYGAYSGSDNHGGTAL